MNILDILLNLQGVYWPPTTANKFGQSSFGIPVQIRCKYQSSTSQGISSQGKTFTKAGTVFTDYELKEGGYIWIGSLVNAPTTPPNKQIIQSVSKASDPDNTETLYTASY